MEQGGTLNPDWLARDLEEASSDYALAMPFDIGDERLDEDDARRLRAKLAKRYADWTGRDLAADLAAG